GLRGLGGLLGVDDEEVVEVDLLGGLDLLAPTARLEPGDGLLDLAATVGVAEEEGRERVGVGHVDGGLDELREAVLREGLVQGLRVGLEPERGVGAADGGAVAVDELTGPEQDLEHAADAR